MFKQIKGYPNYTISDKGIVINTKYDRVKEPSFDKVRKTYRVELFHNNKSKQFYIHQLVAKTFIPNPDNKPYVIHIDGDNKNNSVSNLMWADKQDVANFGVKTNKYQNVGYTQHLIKLARDFKDKTNIDLIKFLEDERDGKIKWSYKE